MAESALSDSRVCETVLRRLEPNRLGTTRHRVGDIVAIAAALSLCGVLGYLWYAGLYRSPASLIERVLPMLGYQGTVRPTAIFIAWVGLFIALLLVHGETEKPLGARVAVDAEGWGPVSIRGLDISLAEVLARTKAAFSGTSSDAMAPPEIRPGDLIIRLALAAPLLVAGLLLVAAYGLVAAMLAVIEPGAYKGGVGVALMMVTATGALLAGCSTLFTRLKAKSAAHLMEYDQRTPVLILRPFKSDRSTVLVTFREDALIGREARAFRFEQCLSELLSPTGPVIALAGRREVLPRLGAARAYVDGGHWQRKIETWLERAGLVLVVAGRGSGLSWEIAKIGEMGLLGKTVFVLPPTTLRSARKSGSSAKAWTEVALQIADPNLREVLGRIDTSDALAIWRGRDGRVFVVRGDTRRFEFYEAALRIAYYELRHGCPTEAF